MEKEIYGDETEIPNFFRLVKAYFCNTNETEHSIDYKLSKLVLKGRGGQCFNREKFNPDEITHIVVDKKCFNLKKYKSSKDSMENKPIVSHEWIIDSDKMKRTLNVNDYIVEN